MALAPRGAQARTYRQPGKSRMDRISDLLGMGGYAEFVWPAFGVTLLVMVGLVLVSRRSLQADRRTLESLESVRAARRKGRSPEPPAGDGDKNGET